MHFVRENPLSLLRACCKTQNGSFFDFCLRTGDARAQKQAFCNVKSVSRAETTMLELQSVSLPAC